MTDETVVSASSGSAGVAHRIAGSAATLVLRRVIVTGMSFVASAVLARTFRVEEFGAFNAGLAVFYLLVAGADFGFGHVLARELGSKENNDGHLVRSMLVVQLFWGAPLTLIGLIVSLMVGGVQGNVVLALLPALLLQGLSGIRQVFYAQYQTRRLGLIDIATNAGQSALVICLALLGASAVSIAAVTSLLIAANSLIVFKFGRALITSARPSRSSATSLFRLAIPLGVGSVLSSAYFMLDMVLLGFIVDELQLGYYAAAVKILSALVTLPGLVTTAALSGVSAAAGDVRALSALVARLAHWLAALTLPACVLMVLFAPLVVELAFGDKFEEATPLVRIVSVAAAVSLINNILSAAMIAERRTRWIVSQNAAALVFNLAGNLILAPRFGVVASAWISLATEVVVCAGGLLALKGRVLWVHSIRPLISPISSLLVCVGVSLVLFWQLNGSSWFVFFISGGVYLVTLIITKGWPEELVVWKVPRVRK